MKKTHRRFAFSYDWDREIATCEPEYYRWNQWFFLQLYERGLAYRKKSKVNWCPKCATVLANEQVVNGCCWRHEDTIVEQRELEQWFLRITKYADELLRDLDRLPGWPEKVRTMQRNWIGRSEGTLVDFRLDYSGGDVITVFTTRVDTIYGATSVQLAPEHPITQELAALDLIAMHHEAVVHAAQAEDGGFRPVDDWREAEAADGPDVRNREGAAAHLFRRYLSRAGALGQADEFLGKLAHRLAVGVVQHGHEQSLRRIDGDADVVVFLEDHLLLVVVIAAVAGGELFQGRDHGFDDIRQ